MTKVFAAPGSPQLLPSPSINDCKPVHVDADPTVLTVWKKSLILNCDGFTVFDAVGNLVFRVDNYMSRSKAEIFLMDASGNSLLTIRRKKLSLGDSWSVFDGETTDNPRFTINKNVNILKTKCLAYLNLFKSGKNETFSIEGNYGQRCCGVYDEKRRRVAEIKLKEASVRGVAFGTDIFRLVVQPGFDATLAMAVVIILDQIFGSRRVLTGL